MERLPSKEVLMDDKEVLKLALKRIVEEDAHGDAEVATHAIMEVITSPHTDGTFTDNMCILHGILENLRGKRYYNEDLDCMEVWE